MHIYEGAILQAEMADNVIQRLCNDRNIRRPRLKPAKMIVRCLYKSCRSCEC